METLGQPRMVLGTVKTAIAMIIMYIDDCSTVEQFFDQRREKELELKVANDMDGGLPKLPHRIQ